MRFTNRSDQETRAKHKMLVDKAGHFMEVLLPNKQAE
jgi:hypothetical protein